MPRPLARTERMTVRLMRHDGSRQEPAALAFPSQSLVLWRPNFGSLSAAFGLAFTLPEDLKTVYLGFGNDLALRNGDPSWRLPVPARFVIDAGGIVRAVQADPDYTYRPEPETTIDALRKVVDG